MSQTHLHRIPALADNYIWILHHASSNQVAIVDPGDAQVVIDTIEANHLVPSVIINTHYHSDHIAGNAELLARYNIPLIAPQAEAHKIPNVTTTVSDGDVIDVVGYQTKVIATPGHTHGHVAYYMPDYMDGQGIAFVGDTLFSLGCGRVFEGTMQEMWESLKALRNFKPTTLLCCGHEYSSGNARYVESLNWERKEAIERIAEIQSQSRQGLATVPTTLMSEQAANPFLNCDTADLAACFGLSPQDDVEVFTALRQGKDRF